MEARVLIPAEFALSRLEVTPPLTSAVCLCAQRRVERGARFWPEQGAVRLGRLPEEHARHAAAAPLDLRRFGSYDETVREDGGRAVRRCNWVRFLRPASSAGERANLRAALGDDGRPQFEALRPIAPHSPLVADFPAFTSRHQEDTPPDCTRLVAAMLRDGPLDLSQELLPRETAGPAPVVLAAKPAPEPRPCTPPLRVLPSVTLSQRLRGQQRTLLPCEVCGKAFDRPSLLKRHMRTHTGERPHACDVCEKRFSTSSSLNTHRRIHSGEKPHACGVCGKRFTASSNLYYHRMTHTKEKPHKCSLCLKSFPTPGDLRSHQYVHSGAWPFRCSACGRGFSKQTNLRNHLFLHTGDKPHVCAVCGKKFALACNLRAHAKTHEEEEGGLLGAADDEASTVAPSSTCSPSPPPPRAALMTRGPRGTDTSLDRENAAPPIIQWDLFPGNLTNQHSPVDMAKVAALWSGCTMFPFSVEELQRGLMLEAQMLLNALQQQQQEPAAPPPSVASLLAG